MLEITKPVELELQAFNRMLDELIDHENDLIRQVQTHIFAKRGKQIRPVLTLLCAKACLGEEKLPLKAFQAALSIELLHTASLQHDDVVDESNLRRGQATTNAEWGNKVAVLVGDFLLAQSVSAVARTHDVRIVDAIAEVGARLADGELLQLNEIASENYNEDIYYRIIERKTAHLFSIAARCGALAADASVESVAALENYALELGLAFQLKDDILDCISSSEELGKPTGNDEREHKKTLPQVMGITYAEQRMQEHRAKAVEALQVIPDSESKQSLLKLFDYCINRRK